MAEPATARPAAAVTAAGATAAIWSLGFAGVSVWQLAAGPAEGSPLAGHATGLAVMVVMVLVLKLLGAALAVAAVTPRRLGLPVRPVAVGLWAAAGLLVLYSAGSLVIAAGTTSGALAPSAAWTAAGGVTARAVWYVLFGLAGAAAFGVLAVWFHRRHRLRWPVVAAGLVGAPVVLAVILGVGPAILGAFGLLPA